MAAITLGGLKTTARRFCGLATADTARDADFLELANTAVQSIALEHGEGWPFLHKSTTVALSLVTGTGANLGTDVREVQAVVIPSTTTATGFNLSYLPWEKFRRVQLANTATANTPINWAVDLNASPIALYTCPVPATATTARYDYIAKITAMSADNSSSGLPEEFDDLLRLKLRILLYDDGITTRTANQMQDVRNDYDRLKRKLAAMYVRTGSTGRHIEMANGYSDYRETGGPEG